MPQVQVRFQSLTRGFAVTQGDDVLWVEALTPSILRVRKFVGVHPPVSPLIRYGIFRDDWPDAKASTRMDDDGATLDTPSLSVAIAARDLRLIVRGPSGEALLTEHEPGRVRAEGGFDLSFRLGPDDRLFGLGDQTRERLEHRGTQGDLWVRNVKSYIPIPLLLSTAGVGVLIHSTYRIRYDLGASAPDRFGFGGTGGPLDYYILYGPSLKEQIAGYTAVTGRPPLPPKWAFGLWFICRTQADAREFMDDCHSFRRLGIPCDAISLEPGWMAKNYDYSVDKKWHPDRFPIPSYAPRGRHNFLPAARRMGFKPGLWLCCDYDLSFEEERRARAAAATSGEAVDDAGTSAEGYEQDEHLGGVRRLDTLTRPDEPWFEHLKQFVDQGVEWFKQDGANQVLSHPDRLYGNGMLDDQMHNLYPLLYSKQMVEGFVEHTGRRTLGFTVAGWAGLQKYTATWTGDTGGEIGPLAACLNSSLSGHGMTTCDMEVTTTAGIHFGFLLPWSQLNSWNYWRHPWYQGEKLESVFREYAHLRYRLLPYLYSTAWQAHRTGLPMLRAMPLEFPDDREADKQLHQYLLGPNLLVGAFTERVWLPTGVWYDFWTGARFDGPGWITPDIPENRGGPLLVRGGAIIPMSPVMDYVGQKPEVDLELCAWAGADGEFTLYEDDGISFAYRQGACRTTRFELESGPDRMLLTIHGAEGEFPEACEQRDLTVRLRGLRNVGRIEVDGNDRAVESIEGAQGVRLGSIPAATSHRIVFYRR